MSKSKTLQEVGEVAAIAEILKHLPNRSDIITGAGDDCAVVKIDPSSSTDLLLTSDPVIENIHFSASTSPESIGHKALGRILSDIAAMGGDPRWALFNIVAMPSSNTSTIDGIYKGAGSLAEQYGISIVGGDMAQGEQLEIHAFGIGTIPENSAILRSGANKDDAIFVTGNIGGSNKGRHLSFLPRIKEGIFLRDYASSMIDITDGLASDLRHIASSSELGASIDLSTIPLSADADNVENALYDGEDFELLFTIPQDKLNDFQSEWKKTFTLPCSRIGIMTSNSHCINTIDSNGTASELKDTGFQHFSL